MDELQQVLDACRQARARGESAVLATVVRVTGSAYRRPGARMLFLRDRESVGLVSGGCLEADLAQRAEEVFDSGQSRTVVYDMRSPDDLVWGLGLGCNGEIRVLLELLAPTHPPEYFDFLERCFERREPGVVASVFDVDGPTTLTLGSRATLSHDGSFRDELNSAELSRLVERDATEVRSCRRTRVASYALQEGRAEVLVEFVAPPVSLVVYGAGTDARPMVDFAAKLGWQVQVFDHREASACPDAFPGARSVRVVDFSRLSADPPEIDENTAVIVMTHHFLNDLEVMQSLVDSPTVYIGVLGPRQRTANLLRELEKRGIQATPEQLDRIYGPVGIDIGSETPEEIALSALAEIRAVLSRRRGGFLRERRAPLHDESP